MALLGSDDGPEAVGGDFVTAERIEDVAPALRDDEEPLFLARGSTFAVDGDAGVEPSGDRRGHVWLAATRDAVAVVPAWDEHGVRISYGDVGRVSFTAAASPPRLGVATDDARYRLAAELPGRRELVAMAGYVRGRARRARRDGDPDPVATIAALTVLLEADVIDHGDYLDHREQALDGL